MAIIDINSLTPPNIIDEPSFEEAFADLKNKLCKLDPNLAPVLELESEPLTNLLQIFAYELVQTYKKVNYAARASFIAFAEKQNLDFLAMQDKLERRMQKDGDKIIWQESDADFRLRIQASKEKLSNIVTGDKLTDFIATQFYENLGVNIGFAIFNVVFAYDNDNNKFVNKYKSALLNFFDEKTVAKMQMGQLVLTFKPINDESTIDATQIYDILSPIEKSLGDMPAMRFYVVKAKKVAFKQIKLEYWLAPNTPNDFKEQLNAKLNSYCKSISFLGQNVYAADIVNICMSFANVVNAKAYFEFEDGFMHIEDFIKASSDELIINTFYYPSLPAADDINTTPPNFFIDFKGYEQ